MAESRQPERRTEAQQAVDALSAAVPAAMLLGIWQNIDVLTGDDLAQMADSCRNLLACLADAQYQLGRAMAKRSGQSVSGRFSTYVDSGRKRRIDR